MLGKLFKHDMRQISKILLPFMVFVFGTTILGTAALKFAREISYNSDGGVIRNLFSVSLYFIFAFSVFALFAYSVLAVFLSISRYYKNLFTDEGYLTFTLPVKSSTLIFSKLWSTLIWTIISVVVVIVCIFLYITFGGAPIGKVINADFYKALGETLWSGLKWFFSELNVSYAFIAVEVVALGLVSMVYWVLLLFLAITIGSIVAKKHKILASIGFYYAINTAASTVTTVVMTILAFGTVGMHDLYMEQAADTFVHVFLVSMFFIYAAIMVTEFLLTNHLLKKKLNLQ